MVRPIPHEAGHKLTGNQRVRLKHSLFSVAKLILQVEESFYYYTWTADWHTPEMPTKYRWRDATTADITGGLVVCI